MIRRLLGTFCALAFTATSAFAGSRTSASYTILADTTEGSGTRAQSPNYTLNGCAIGEQGTGAAAIAVSGSYALKPGYVGELYEIVALSITAPPSTSLNEGATRQLVAAPLGDDLTTLAPLNPNVVNWSVLNGPIGFISATGLATASNVYEDAPATVRGAAFTVSGQLNLSVLNVGLDDYDDYAGDMVDDAWQVDHFGEHNPAGLGNADPDGDGQNNKFEFVAGLIPTDPVSRFTLRIQTVVGQPGQKRLVFSPRLADRTYSAKYRTDLSTGTWITLTHTTQSDNASERTVTDLSASGTARFYEVEISKP